MNLLGNFLIQRNFCNLIMKTDVCCVVFITINNQETSVNVVGLVNRFKPRA